MVNTNNLRFVNRGGGNLDNLNCFHSVIKNIGEILYSFSYYNDS